MAPRRRPGAGLALAVPDRSVVSEYPREVVLNLPARPRLRAFWGVPLVGLAVLGLRVSVVVVVAAMGVMVVVAVGVLVGYRRSRVVLGPQGLRSRWPVSRERFCAWSDLDQLLCWRGPRTTAILAVRTDGTDFLLAAPLDSPPSQPDPTFDATAARVAAYARDARRDLQRAGQGAL